MYLKNIISHCSFLMVVVHVYMVYMSVFNDSNKGNIIIHIHPQLTNVYELSHCHH